MTVTFQILGLRELERDLVTIAKTVDPRKAGNALQKGLRKPMEDVLIEARLLAPQPGHLDKNGHQATGTLRDALELTGQRASAQRASSAAENLASVGIRIRKVRGPGGRYPRRYWHLVEFGTAHSAARPFLRPAFDKNQQHLLAEFKTVVSGEITKILRMSRRPRGRR